MPDPTPQFEIDSTVYLDDGSECILRAITSDGLFVVCPLIENDWYDDEGEPWQASPQFAIRVFSEPPKLAVDQEVTKAQEKLEAIVRAIKEAEREHKSTIAGFTSTAGRLADLLPGLERLESMLKGEHCWLVVRTRYGDDLHIMEWTNGPEDFVRIEILRGKVRTEVCRNDDRGWESCSAHSSKEEAEEAARRFAAEDLQKAQAEYSPRQNSYRLRRARTAAERFGVPVPKEVSEILDGLDRAEAEKEIEKAERSLAKARAKMPASS